jgi:hypothetical protein
VKISKADFLAANKLRSELISVSSQNKKNKKSNWIGKKVKVEKNPILEINLTISSGIFC